ncbi:MAG: crotonobetainyl-CoA:carnitine CoA-transferase CaiB-like acyl-CoA transferase [Hyphomicrobiaceae bacterium]|jgi:crotonobetainyl-CoA:carnitine CoA-transferase CaiB-like acyl-CoA transferase
MSAPSKITNEQLAHIWQLTSLPAAALDNAQLDITEATLPSSYHVAAAATASIAAAGLAASELWRLRSGGETQTVSVSSRHAETEFLSEHRLSIDGNNVHRLWGPIAGLFKCGDGRWVRIHANYPHHEAGVLEILKCEPTKDAVEKTLQSWTAPDFEDACGEKGLVVFMMRSAEEWAQHGQAQALELLPLFDIERIGDAPPEPLPAGGTQPLSGISVLDLTRVIAGPVCGRTLAAHGADVLRISAARLPRDPLLLEVDGGRGKRSTYIDLKEADGRAELEALARKADVFVQGYRPGAMDANGFSPERLAELRPGIVSVSISAWGHEGPWSHRRGFDSLVQTASGINHGEAQAAGIDGPKPLPCQALDFASGYLMAMGAMVGLHKRATEGGSWRVRVALARTGRWLQSLGRIDNGFSHEAATNAELADLFTTIPNTGYGKLDVIKHPIHLSKTPASINLAPVPYPQS